VGRLLTAGAGATAAYFLDPQHGVERRQRAEAMVRDYWAHWRRMEQGDAGSTARGTHRLVRRAA
jgi:hypothetical protein